MKQPPPSINPSLLWEYDTQAFKEQPSLWQTMSRVVIQRVIERGWPRDWEEMLRYYGYEYVREIVKTLSFTEPRDRNFVCIYFDLQPQELWSTEKRLMKLRSV